MKTRGEKKRKVSSDGDAVSVKTDDAAAAPTVVAPPDHSNLSPVQKILLVDLLKDDSNVVESAMSQLTNMCLSSNENSEENRANVHRLGGASIITGIMKKYYGFPAIQASGC